MLQSDASEDIDGELYSYEDDMFSETSGTEAGVQEEDVAEPDPGWDKMEFPGSLIIPSSK